MPGQAVLLDVDGTLVDSNPAHAHAWVEALAASGRRVDLLRVRPLVGMWSVVHAALVKIECEPGRAIVIGLSLCRGSGSPLRG